MAAGAQWNGPIGELDRGGGGRPFRPTPCFRPLYQAYLLPDVAVVGGLAEVAYWLQLTTAYAAFGLARPALVPRDGARVVPAEWTALAASLGVSRSEFGEDFPAWEARWLHIGWAFHRFLGGGGGSRSGCREGTLHRVGCVPRGRCRGDPGQDAQAAGQAGWTGQRALRRQHAEELAELTRLHGWLYPDGNPQERVANVHVLAEAWQEEEPR